VKRTREGWSTGTTVTLTLLEDLKAVFFIVVSSVFETKPLQLANFTRNTHVVSTLALLNFRERSSFASCYFLYICIRSRVPHFEFKQANCERAPPHRDNYILYVLYLSSISVQFEHVHAAYVADLQYADACITL
jgi:hypothetical protein